MVNNNPGQQPPPPGSQGSQIPILSTTSRRPGLRSGGPPPEPPPGQQPARTTGRTRLPVRTDNRENPAAPATTGGDVIEPAPPSYSERVESGADRNPRTDLGALSQEPGPGSENSREALQMEHTLAETQGNQQPGDRDAIPRPAQTIPTIPAQPVNQGEPQRVQIVLDPEISETIRRMAQEQRDIRKEIEGSREDTYSLRVLVKTHESRLGLVFKRIGDVIDDQWALRAGMDELREEVRATVIQRRTRESTPTNGTVKPEPTPSDNGRRSDPLPESAVAPRWDIESLYASEGERGAAMNQEQPRTEDPQQNPSETPGETWIRNRSQPQRFGLGTEEAVEHWRAASEASRQRRAARRNGEHVYEPTPARLEARRGETREREDQMVGQR